MAKLIISTIAFAASHVQAQYYRLEAPSTHLKVESCRDIQEDTYGDPKGTCAEHGFKEFCISCMLAMKFNVKDSGTCDQKHSECYFRAPGEECVGTSQCPHSKYDTNATSQATKTVANVAQRNFPDPSEILGKLACSVLTDKKRENIWVTAFCNAGPNPKLQECIRDFEVQWDKFAAKCPADSVANLAQRKFPDPSKILGKFSCNVLTDKKRESAILATFCSAKPACIKDFEAEWDKLAAKCPADSVLV